MKTFFIFSAILVAVLQYKLWFAGDGVPQVWRLQQSVDRQVAQNIKLRERNASLGAQVDDLKRGKQTAEGHAREELGMIKDGEVYYQIVKGHTYKSNQ
jgi:cell division protein FtsB